MYTRCTITKLTCQFTRPWENSGVDGMFVHRFYSRVQLQQLGVRAGATGCAHNLGGPLLPCTLGVGFRKRACQFTRPWGALWLRGQFRTLVVWSCTFPGSRARYRCHRLCTQSGRSRSTLYTICTITITRMPIHKAMGSTLTQTASSYTRCTVLYSSGISGSEQVTRAVYTIWEVP